MRFLTPLSLALAVAFLLAACGSDEEGDEATPAPSSADVIEISATEFAFGPANVEVEGAGEHTFRLVNDGSMPHALAIEGVEGASTEVIGPGETAELTVELGSGEWVMFCPVGNHRQQGMEGTIVVGGAAGGGGATTDGEGTTTEDDSGGGGYYGGG